jgi:outer membrane protein TolC
MKRLAHLAAAAVLALSSLPAAAQPRGRAQPGAASAPAASNDPDDGDGPEAKGVALFKLDDIIEVAVRLSPDIARARADRDAARGSAAAAGKDQSWVLSANATYQRETLAPNGASNRLEPLAVVASDTFTGAVALGRFLPTGGNISVELDLSHVRRELNVTGEALTQAMMQQSECGENVDIFCQDQATAKVTLKQPLARGVGSDVALAGQRKADLAAVQATVNAQLASELLIRDLVTAYWELAYAAYEVDVRADSLELARKQEQVTRQEMRAGTAAQNSLDQVTYEIAVREEALLSAKLVFEKQSLDLRRKVGLEIGRRDIVVRPSEPFEIDNRDWNVDDVLARSHKINRQLASKILEKKIADVDVDVTHNALLPQVDFSLSAGLVGTGDTASGAFNADNSGYTFMAGLSLSFELSGAAKGANAAAVARRHRLDVDRLDLERQIDAEVVSSVKKVISGRTRVALSDKAIAIAEENVKAERASFLAQRSTNGQVMQRQTQLADARLRRGRAVTEYHLAVAQLQYLSGTLFDAYRIHVRARPDQQD